MTKMNSTSLYITTNRIILSCDPNNSSTWQDLYRLVPYLRNSLTCVVCGNLLIDPVTPSSGKCQHHLCKKCKSGRKRIKPTCAWCKECETYSDNKQLRTLLQCYKKMCLMLLNSGIYSGLQQASKIQPALGVERGASNLMVLIKEGATFQDEYQSNVGLSKSDINILPCLYTSSSSQTLTASPANSAKPVLNPTVNRNPLYSVLHAGSGSKITIKRKGKEAEKLNRPILPKRDNAEKATFKKPPQSKCPAKQRQGCRCGNATPTPGKLTCCGQRCPCYVESKACIECKCRGCRNPHAPDGSKVINLPELLKQFQGINQQQVHQVQPQQYKIQQKPVYRIPQPKPDLPAVKIELEDDLTLEQLNEQLKLNMYDSFTDVTSELPSSIFIDTMKTEDCDEDEEITVDV